MFLGATDNLREPSPLSHLRLLYSGFAKPPNSWNLDGDLSVEVLTQLRRPKPELKMPSRKQALDLSPAGAIEGAERAHPRTPARRAECRATGGAEQGLGFKISLYMRLLLHLVNRIWSTCIRQTLETTEDSSLSLSLKEI